jgi:ferric-dicitrate binding protein FerR (iron transport regulator)
LKNRKKHINDKNSIEKQILNHSSSYAVPTGKSKEEVWIELSQKINRGQITNRKSSFSIVYKLTAAAIILIVSSIAFLYSDTKITTGFAETSKLYLPDSSYVLLRAASSVAFNKRLWSSNRELELDGEAFFSVKKGSNFTVKTKEGRVQVLGTKFNVISRAQSFNVACVSGKVRVSLKKNNSNVILTKGLYTEMQRSGQLSEPSEKNIDEITGRNKGEFYFKKTDLKLVFEELERQFNIELEYQDIENRQFTGYFVNKNLETALKMVCKPMELEYTVNNRLVTIKNLSK